MKGERNAGVLDVDAGRRRVADDWENYIDKLVALGKFRGGSALGNGICVTRNEVDGPCTVTGFMRFEARSLGELRELLQGNPVYEAGGKVEISEIVET